MSTPRNYSQLPKLFPSWKRVFGNTHAAKAADTLLNKLSAGILTVSYSIAAESSNMIDVTCTFTDESGQALPAGVAVEFLILANAAGTDFTANTYTLAAGALGKIAAVVANKIVRGITGTGGKINLQITNAGAVTCYVGVVGPSGKLTISGAVTHT